MRDAEQPKWHAGLASLLIALALLPLAGASWFAVRELRDVSEARRATRDVGRDADLAADLVHLRASLIEEHNWALILARLDDPSGVEAGQTTGSLAEIDPAAKLAVAQALVDADMTAVGDAELSAIVSKLRANTSASSVDAALYESTINDIQRRTHAVIDSLILTASNLEDGSPLVESLRVLRSSADLRVETARASSAFVNLRFMRGDEARREQLAITQQLALYDGDRLEVERHAAPSSEALAIVTALDSNPHQNLVRSWVEEATLETLQPIDNGAMGSLATAARSNDDFTVLYNATTKVGALHTELVEAAASDVTEAGQALSDASTDATNRSVGTILLLSIASVAVGIALIRFVGRPLRRLEHGAQKLRDGDTKVLTKPTGPTEVRHATEAINEAAAHLSLAERQATALANGDLSHPSLRETAPGALGSSLQTAVHTLATSLGEREQFRRRLAHQASHDGLTQLPNRSASLQQLRRCLARARRSEATVAVMFVDLDGFKEINDRHGHQAGDAVLHAVAKRLVNSAREGDHVGRLGGDEFLVIAEPISGPSAARATAQRLLSALGEPLRLENTTVSVSASIGIALAVDSSVTAEELLRDADLAVYKAKEAGRARIEVFDADMRAAAVRELDLGVELRRALNANELTLFYQPIVHPESGLTLSAEALLRWIQPGRGVLRPGEFLPAAERSNLMSEIDRWVLERAAEQLSAWTDHPDFADIPVSVNISGQHLSSNMFVPSVLQPLRDRGIDPSRLVIEVTESAVVDDIDDAALKLQQVRDSGVKVAIDDFGTGYTSVTRLKSLPFDVLKIDGSMTRDANAHSLVKLLVDIGHLLGARVIAEGVENVVQAHEMMEIGCDELQGYLFGRPVPPAELKERSTNGARLGGRAASDQLP